jgi:hypothetical protein
VNAFNALFTARFGVNIVFLADEKTVRTQLAAIIAIAHDAREKH